MRFLNFSCEVPTVMDGETLTAARQLAGLSQKQLADDLGVSLKTVNNWENGRNRIPAGAQAIIETEFAEELLRIGRSDNTPRLGAASDLELLAEVARRFARTRESATEVEEAWADDGPEPTVLEVLGARAEAEQKAARTVPGGGLTRGQRARKALDEAGEESQE